MVHLQPPIVCMCVCMLVCAGERVKDTDPLWFTLGDYNVCERYQLGTLCHTKEEDIH